MEYTIGTKIPLMPGWEIVSELGEGSYGKVFELKKEGFSVTAKAALKVIRIPRSVAEIKEAYNEGMDEKSVTAHFEGIVERFMKEIAIMSELKSNPNIVACEDYCVEPHAGTIGWDILIRMELLTSLTDYQLKHPMQEEDVRRLGIDICSALDYCQKKGLIHRDVKPGNVFVDREGRFKLGDFGVARTAEKTMGGYSKQGTENYMAPEVYLGKPYGATVDVYSLGLMLYRMMNRNRLPFLPAAPAQIEFSDRENALTKRVQGEPLPAPCNASEEFAEIILKACAYDSMDRYRTAAEMLEALRGENLNKVIAKEAVKNDKDFNSADPEEDNSIGVQFVRPQDVKEKVEQEADSEETMGFNFGRSEYGYKPAEPDPGIREEVKSSQNQKIVKHPTNYKFMILPLALWNSWMILNFAKYYQFASQSPLVSETLHRLFPAIVFGLWAAVDAIAVYTCLKLSKREVIYAYGSSILVSCGCALVQGGHMYHLMSYVACIGTLLILGAFAYGIRNFLGGKKNYVLVLGIMTSFIMLMQILLIA